MSQPLIDFVRSEYDYLRGRQGRDFFLAISPYLDALRRKRRLRRLLDRLQRETTEALTRYVEEQNTFIAQAQQLRHELASHAPEIDNSDLLKPDEASHEWMQYAYDSFARFDELASSEMRLGYPTLPEDDHDPGPVGDLIGILRGRVRAAEYGEDPQSNTPKLRDDLDDLRRQIRNLAERRAHALRRYRHEAHTLPGLAYDRLVYFGTTLNPEPLILAENEDQVTLLNRMLQDMFTARSTVRKLVNNEIREQYDRDSAQRIEQTLKDELDRLQQELARRLPLKPGPLVRFLQDQTLKIIGGVVVAVITAAILVYLGIRG